MSARSQPMEVGMAPATEDPRSSRYRDAERVLWSYYGIKPVERYIELRSFSARLRVLEVGSGEPVVFVPGTAGTGPVWGSLLSRLDGYRCLLLDRPGWGFSAPIDYTKQEYGHIVADVMKDVLDSLELAHTHVVGASIGNVWAMRAAQVHPQRIRRAVLLGGGPLVSETPPPRIIRLIASPIGALMVRLGENPKRVKSILRSNGHGVGLDAGRIPEEYVEWRVSLGRETPSMRFERDMVRSLLAGKQWKPGLTFTDEEVGRLQHPTLMIYGSADPVGSVDVWRRFVDLLPKGALEVVQSAGHVPWLDDPAGVAGSMDRFLRGS
jgi:2-hydroxy-6-oxonona-2,4-dienedioate hydrolase